MNTKIARNLPNECSAKGGAVAEWSKALQLREKINENKKDPRFATPAWATLKNECSANFRSERIL